MHIDSDQAIPHRVRCQEIAADIREVALTVASILWVAAGAAFFVGICRIVWKIW